jgi:tetratricopeptide (TPR) repeat protein
MTRPKLPRRKPYVPRRVLPPISRRRGSTEFRGEILEEFGELGGIVLWFACRDAELWAMAPDKEGLFAEAPAQWSELIVQLDATFAPAAPRLRLLASLAGGREAAAVATDCGAIAEWAEERSKLATAVEFSQVASLVDPEFPLHAARTARLLKDRAEWDRAASWYDQAIFTARRVEDWCVYADAYCGLGDLYFERGNLPRARRLFRRALRAAIRHHIDEQIANAYHYLFTLEAVAGNWERAEAFVVNALAKYPEHSPRRARLARDLGYRWILRGYFERALPLAQEVLHHFTAPGLRALVWSDIARAAAGAGDEGAFETAWAQAKVLVDGGVTDPYTPTILLNLAHGAAFRGEVARATFPARTAAEIARARGEPQFVLEAEALLDSLKSAGFVRPERGPPRLAGDLVDEVLRIMKEHRAVA